MMRRILPRLALALLALLPVLAWPQSRVQVEVQGIDSRIDKNVDALIRKNIGALLDIERQSNDANLTDARIERLHRRATRDIQRALEPFGYYQARINASLRREGDLWLARYDIELGEPVRVAAVQIEVVGSGSGDPRLEKIIAAFPLRGGDILHHQRYEQGKRDLLRGIASSGYLNAEFARNQVRIDKAGNVAYIDLAIETQTRYLFGAIRFTPGILQERLLHRYLEFHSGDPYNSNQLINLENALYDSDYFARVEVNDQRAEAKNNEIPIDVVLTPGPRHRYTLGAGYGTDTGPRGSLGWNHRRINTRGHRFKSLLKLSEVKSSLLSAYTIPIRNPRTDHLEASASWIDENSGEFEDETWTLGLARTISRSPDWLETVYIKYQTDSYVAELSSGKSTVVMPGVTWSRITADDRVFTRLGLRITLDVRGGHKELGSDVQFIQVTAGSKAFIPIGSTSRLILRGDIGTTDVETFADLPPTLRYYAGGDLSVRGYGYNSLSPGGEGGEHLLIGGMTLERFIIEKWSVAVFSDAGNAMNGWDENLRKSAGLGVRWLSPVGQVRLDVATPIGEPDRNYMLHVVIGPDL